jgi:hypothetical protein
MNFARITTYASIAGLVGLAIFKASVGDVPGAITSIVQAVGVAGIGHAVHATADVVAPPTLPTPKTRY